MCVCVCVYVYVLVSQSPGKNTRVDSYSLLQGIFLIQGSSPGLLLCRQILYHLSHQRSPGNCLLLANSCSQVFHHCPALAKPDRKSEDKGAWEMRFLVIGEDIRSRKWTLEQTGSLPSRSVYAMITHRFDMRQRKKTTHS